MRIIKNHKGVTAVEFALLAPIVLLFIFATIEISWLMLSASILENSVRMASRAGITGYVPSGMTRDEFIRQQIDGNLIILDPAKIQFDTLIYDSYANIGQPEPFIDQNANSSYDLGEPYTDINGNAKWDDDMGTAGKGGAGAIMVYKVTYPYKILTPIVSQFFANNGNFDLHSNMVVRNEPF